MTTEHKPIDMMDIQEILKFLPHRYPFLLVDRICHLELGRMIQAYKNVTINEPFFQGHFPVKAVMPGVLIIESLAQAAGVLAYKSTQWNAQTSLFYLAAIGETRFKKMVVPGDRLDLSIEVQKCRKKVWKFQCEASVEGALACVTEMTCMEGAAQ